MKLEEGKFGTGGVGGSCRLLGETAGEESLTTESPLGRRAFPVATDLARRLDSGLGPGRTGVTGVDEEGTIIGSGVISSMGGVDRARGGWEYEVCRSGVRCAEGSPGTGGAGRGLV